jgi:hypothetical protein
MSDVWLHLDGLSRSPDGDAGCTAGELILDAHVELELAGDDPAAIYPGTVTHPSELSRLPGRSRRPAGGCPAVGRRADRLIGHPLR